MKRGRQQVRQRAHDQNVLLRKRVLLAAFDVQHTQQRLAVSDRDTQHRARLGKDAGQVALVRLLNQRPFIAARDAPHDASSQGNALPLGLGGRTRFRLDLDFLGDVIKNADADVIEAEGLLNFGNDVSQHLLCILARDGGFRDAVEECQLVRAT